MDAVFVIAFVAAGCPPCDAFKADLRHGSVENDVRIVVVDVKDRPELVAKCRVTVTPTFVVVRDERQVSRKSGYTSPESLNQWLEEVKPVARR